MNYYNYGQMQNPMNYYSQYMNQPQPTQNNLIRVTGIEGARAYQMCANSTVALFDNNEDLMYVKMTDGANFPTIRTFRFEEVKEDSKPVVKDDYVNKDEFETFKKEVVDYVQQFIQQQSKQTQQDFTTNGISEQLKSKQSRNDLQTNVSK